MIGLAHAKLLWRIRRSYTPVFHPDRVLILNHNRYSMWFGRTYVVWTNMGTPSAPRGVARAYQRGMKRVA
jgi:hypothetical protein